jgi:hypothetical protein
MFLGADHAVSFIRNQTLGSTNLPALLTGLLDQLSTIK